MRKPADTAATAPVSGQNPVAYDSAATVGASLTATSASASLRLLRRSRDWLKTVCRKQKSENVDHHLRSASVSLRLFGATRKICGSGGN